MRANGSPPSHHQPKMKRLKTSSELHRSLASMLPTPERQRFQQVCSPETLAYPALNLAALRPMKTIMTPGEAAQGEWRHDTSISAEVCKEGEDGCITHVRANLVGRVRSTQSGLEIDDGTTSIPIIIAPPPPPRTKDAFVHAVNWRYIASDRCQGYFEILLGDIMPLTSTTSTNFASPPRNGNQFTTLRARVNAKSCRIATRKQTCFLVELSGTSDCTIVVFRDEAVAWWPFLDVGSDVIVRGLTLCSLPSYNRRTVFLAAADATVLGAGVAGHEWNETAATPPRSCGNAVSARDSSSSVEYRRWVNYEGVITNIVDDGRFEVDHTITFHPGPIHSFTSISNVFRIGTKIRVSNGLLVKRYDHVRLFTSSRSSIEVLYFGELKTTTGGKYWRGSSWDRLWRCLTFEEIIVAEEIYDMLVEKFWGWLCGESDDVNDRIRCLLGDDKEIGMVQYVMFCLMNRAEVMNRGRRRDVYEEFMAELEDARQGYFIPTLKRAREIVLRSRMKTEGASASLNEESEDLRQIVLHSSKIISENIVLCGLLHTLSGQGDVLCVSDTSMSIRVHIIGTIQPSLIGCIVLLSDYYLTIDFRVEESMIAILKSDDIKVVIDGDYNSDIPRTSLTFNTQESMITARSSAHTSGTRIADVPMVSLFVQRVTLGHTIAVHGKLLGVRGAARESWEVLLHGDGLFDVELSIRGDRTASLAAVRDQECWSVSCAALDDADPRGSLLRRSNAGKVRLCSAFGRDVIPQLAPLGKGEYMRFADAGMYDRLRGLIERLCDERSAFRDVYDVPTGAVVMLRGRVVRTQAWDACRLREGEWVTLVDGAGLDVNVSFDGVGYRARGVAPGMGVVITNVGCVRRPSGGLSFVAGRETALRVLSVGEAVGFDSAAVAALRRADMVDYGTGCCIGVTTIDVVELVELYLARGECGAEEVLICAKLLAEDGTRRAHVLAQGLPHCRALLGVGDGDMAAARGLAGAGATRVDKRNCSALGLGRLFQRGWGFSRVACVLALEEAAGDEVVVRAFALGRGERVWTAVGGLMCLRCVAVVEELVEWRLNDFV